MLVQTRCISSVQLLLSRFYKIRLNESISDSRSFLWDDDTKRGCVKSTFHELGLPFTYSPLLPSYVGNFCCSCYNDYNSTDGEYPLPLCSKCVGTYNGPHLPPITDEFKAYERHFNTMQNNYVQSQRSDSDSDSNFTSDTTISDDHGNTDSDASLIAFDNDDDDSTTSSLSFVYDVNVDMYNGDIEALDNVVMLDTGATSNLPVEMDIVSEEIVTTIVTTKDNANKHGDGDKCANNSNTNNPDVSFYCNRSFKSISINCNSNDSDSCNDFTSYNTIIRDSYDIITDFTTNTSNLFANTFETLDSTNTSTKSNDIKINNKSNNNNNNNNNNKSNKNNKNNTVDTININNNQEYNTETKRLIKTNNNNVKNDDDKCINILD